MAIKTRDSLVLSDLREFALDLERFEGGLEDLRYAETKAARIVRDEAYKRANPGAFKNSKGKFRNSIVAKASKKGSGASVQFGGRGVPHYGVVEFGGSVPRKNVTRLSAEDTRGRKGMVSGGKLMRHRGSMRFFGLAEDTLAMRQGLSKRTFIKEWTRKGYFVFPSLRDKRDEIAETFSRDVIKLRDKYLPERY